MKLGIIFFLIGLVLIAMLLKIQFNKKFLRNIGIAIGVFLFIYGLILLIQPKEDSYIKYTKTTSPNKHKDSK